MKRTFAVAIAMGLLAATLGAPAEAAKRKRKQPVVRLFEVRYEYPAAGVGGVRGACAGCPDIGIDKNETYAFIQIVDDHTPTGYIDLAYDDDGDGDQDLGAGPTVCGETTAPVSVEPGVSYSVWPWVAGTGCPGAASTSGLIKVWLSNDLAALEKAVAGR